MMYRRSIFILVLALFLLSQIALAPSSMAEENRTPKKGGIAKKGQEKKGARKDQGNKAKKGGAKAKPERAAKKAQPAVAEAPASPAVVREMRHWSNPDYTRIAVTLDREVRFEPHQLPQRLYLDFAGRLGPGVHDIPIGDGLLKAARIAQFRADTVRVVLDLDSIKDYKIFTFSDPYRIIIDVKGERREQLTRPPDPALASLPAPPAPAVAERREEKGQLPAPAAISKIRRVVVDAGHGGHDPGAIGAGGTREKDVVLQIALKLARRLREDLGLDVVLTRSTDVFLELQERTAIANQVGADLFVSIHANAAPNRNAAGIETYYLNLAKTEKAAQLAAKENGTSLEKVSLLQAVLFDLMANYKLNDSALLAEEVQKALHKKTAGSYHGTKNLGVKQGPFYVLVGATMPSILVETAFLSNDREEERLKDPAYQDVSAEGIMEGIKGYIAAVK